MNHDAYDDSYIRAILSGVKTVALTPLGAKTRASVIERLHEPPEDLLALDRDDLEELRAALAKLPRRPPPFTL